MPIAEKLNSPALYGICGAIACNVLPQEATVSANMRFIPHQGEAESLALVRSVAQKHGLEMEVLHSNDYSKPVLP